MEQIFMALTISKMCGGIAPSVTLALNARVAQMRAEGMQVISMGAGEPDFDTPAHIRQAAQKALDSGKTRYTAVPGIPELRSAVAAYLKRVNGLDYESNQVILCTGAKQALVGALQAILDEGDEVILPQPCWVSYPEMVRMAGGVSVPVYTTMEQGFVPTYEQLKAAVTGRTKAIIINSPSNPTGAVWTREQLAAAAKLAQEYDFYIISDEIYDKLVFAGAEHVSVPSLSRDAYARTILINGFSKSYAMTGWRIGYAAGPRAVIDAMSAYQSHATGNPSSVSQYAALAALEGDQACVDTMVQAFARRRELMVSLARDIAGISFFEPKGAFYILLNVSKLMGKRVNGRVLENSDDFSQALLESQQVAVVPGEAFGADRCCRLSYAIEDGQIVEALTRIKAFVESII